MNTKDNRRKQQTNENIIRAFFQVLKSRGSIRKVTVREICQQAGVNRSTFYAHYQDVYDVLEKVEKTMARELTKTMLEEISVSLDIGTGFERVFEFIGRYRDFYNIYLNETNQSGVIGIARELYSDKTENLWRDMHLASPEELGYQEDFALAGLTAMVRRWLKRGCPETPHELCQIFIRQYSTDRYRAFQWK